MSTEKEHIEFFFLSFRKMTRYERAYVQLFYSVPHCTKRELSLFCILRIPLYDVVCLCLEDTAYIMKKRPNTTRKNKWFEKRLAGAVLDLDCWIFETYHSGCKGNDKWKFFLQNVMSQRIRDLCVLHSEWKSCEITLEPKRLVALNASSLQRNLDNANYQKSHKKSLKIHSKYQ